MEKRHAAQSELISVMMLVGVTLAIALAAYGYFVNQGASAARSQDLEVALADLRASISMSISYQYNPSPSTYVYYVVLRNHDLSVFDFTFTVVSLAKSGKYFSIVNSTILMEAYVLRPSNGVYTEVSLSPSFLVPPEMIYVEPYTEVTALDNTPIEVYVVRGTGLPGETGCDVLLKLVVSAPDRGDPALLLLSRYRDTYFVVSILDLPRGGG